MHQIEVLDRDLQIYTDQVTRVDQFQLGNFVQLDSRSVGVIVRIVGDSIQVLTMNEKIIETRPHLITRRKENKDSYALDLMGNIIRNHDVVSVIDGLYDGCSGQILHLFRNIAFIRSKLVTRNDVFMVCKTRHLLLE